MIFGYIIVIIQANYEQYTYVEIIKYLMLGSLKIGFVLTVLNLTIKNFKYNNFMFRRAFNLKKRMNSNVLQCFIFAIKYTFTPAISKKDFSIYIEACKTGDLPFIKRLLKRRKFSLNRFLQEHKLMDGISIAASNGNLNVIKYLYNCDKVRFFTKDASLSPMLKCAIYNSHLDIVKFIFNSEKIALDSEKENFSDYYDFIHCYDDFNLDLILGAIKSKSHNILSYFINDFKNTKTLSYALMYCNEYIKLDLAEDSYLNLHSQYVEAIKYSVKNMSLDRIDFINNVVGVLKNNKDGEHLSKLFSSALLERQLESELLANKSIKPKLNKI